MVYSRWQCLVQRARATLCQMPWLYTEKASVFPRFSDCTLSLTHKGWEIFFITIPFYSCYCSFYSIELLFYSFILYRYFDKPEFYSMKHYSMELYSIELYSMDFYSALQSFTKWISTQWSSSPWISTHWSSLLNGVCLLY